METIESLEIMQNRSQLWKKQGERIALVPTMGCLHAGHLSLMRKAREHADKVVVSIFVNPTQFGPNEDFEKYPRQLQEDSAVTEQEGVDILFCPSALEMYPKGYQTTVSVKYLTQGLCGAGRPGHFDGVATVVSKLFNITLPDVAVFGQKDFQQLAVVKQMVCDLNLPITIIGAPIVRETDGLALSSRNKYLKGAMRQQALCLRKAIVSAQKMVHESMEKVAATKITQLAQKIVNEHGGALEYAEIINEATLQREEFITSESVMAIAVKIAGAVRLIDNEKLM